MFLLEFVSKVGLGWSMSIFFKFSSSLKLSATVALALLFFSAEQAAADGPGLDIQYTQGGQELNNGSFSLGWTFSVTSSVSVSALGFYDAGQNGLVSSHDVGIFDESCNLIASTVVEPSDTLIGFFRYHSLSSAVTLSPGQTYRIAAVTGGEPYLYNPTAVVLDPAVVFDKFTAWHGAFQQTSTLLCPDFPASTQFFGDFGPTFYIGALSNNPNDPNKRDTSIKLFCNRSGDLSTASCTATVGDTGAAPRTTPTGTVEFTASEGSLAGTSCVLGAVSLSPGVASCSMTYYPPSGFQIGKAFPVNATYTGDSVFNASSTSHELILASCVGTTSKPCPNSVGLEFDRLQAVLDKVVVIKTTCGAEAQGAALAPRLGQQPRSGFTDIPPPGGACNMFVSLGLDLDKLLSEISQVDLKAISDAFSEQPNKLRDAIFKYADAASALQGELYQLMQANEAATDEIFKVIERDILNENWTKLFSKHVPGIGGNFAVRAATANPKKKESFTKFASITKKVRSNKSAAMRFKLNKRMQNFVGVLKAAGITTVPLKATLSATQERRRGKAKLSQTVYVTID